MTSEEQVRTVRKGKLRAMAMQVASRAEEIAVPGLEIVAVVFGWEVFTDRK